MVYIEAVSPNDTFGSLITLYMPQNYLSIILFCILLSSRGPWQSDQALGPPHALDHLLLFQAVCAEG
jgi:hypothetical protein